jgi:hypothetical protein
MAACTYNLPPDSNTRTGETNLALAQSPKSLKALQQALQSSENNRAREYMALQLHVDSTAIMLAQKISANNDSLMKVNHALQERQLKIMNKMNDIQLILYILLILIVILASYAFMRLPKKGNLKLEPNKKE